MQNVRSLSANVLMFRHFKSHCKRKLTWRRQKRIKTNEEEKLLWTLLMRLEFMIPYRPPFQFFFFFFFSFFFLQTPGPQFRSPAASLARKAGFPLERNACLLGPLARRLHSLSHPKSGFLSQDNYTPPKLFM
jgi:hypothetical protein